MSKVVKGVSRAVSKVASGVKNVVKKVASSKIGKIALAAAAIYFGGAALMGAVGGASAGTGIAGTLSGAISGAGAGISSEWSGLTGALGAGSLSGAASSLGSGFTGAYGAGMSAVAPQLATAMGGAGAGAAGAGAAPMATYAVPGAKTATGLNLLGADAASSGIIGKMMASPYTAPALISGGTQLIGGAMQGYGAQKQYEQQKQDQLDLEAAARDRYNRNIGTRLFGG